MNQNTPTKITYSSWGKSYSVEINHSDISEETLVDLLKALLLLSGWNINIFKEEE